MLNIKDITLIAILTGILFIQEQLLSFIPNIQLTVFLIVLFSKKLRFTNSILICVIYVILDNLFSGSFNLLFTIFMLIGWLIIPISLNTIFKKVESNILLSLLGILFSFIFSWIMIIPGCIVFEMDFITYFIGDITWELIFATSSFISILLLYNPLSNVFDYYNEKIDSV